MQKTAGAATAGPAGAGPKPALTVTTARPRQTRLPIAIEANGNIAAWQEASIGSESGGLRLAEVRVNVGDAVRAGQVLATFAADTAQADVAQARANLVEAQANAADAAGNAERARTLQATGALSTQQINQYLTGAQTAQARMEAARAQLAVQQLRLQHAQVLAPDSGVISARSATVGAVVGTGVELFRLIRQGRLEWRAEVTAAELGHIRAGTPALVTAASGAQLKGRVRMIAPTVDPQTRIALVYVDLPPLNTQTLSAAGPSQGVKAPPGGSEDTSVPSVGAASAAGPPQGAKAPSGGSAVHAVTSVGATLPGMFARGMFDLGSSTALTVPAQAVVARDGFNYVFRLGADPAGASGPRVTQLKVETGRRIGDAVEITRGLSADAIVAVSGAGFLNDGDLVRIVNAAPANPASAATK